MAVKFVKICGITVPEQGKAIAQLGATHIGVIFFKKSPRHISLEQIKKIKEVVPKDTKVVAVTVNPSEETVEKLLNIVDMIQFHGDEKIEFVSKYPEEKIIKAFRIKSEEDITRMKPFMEKGYKILIDAFKEGKYGGTGKQINPELAKKVVNSYEKVILSGGLSPDNIENLLNKIKPYGVDASSKLEIKPGIKDIQKVEEFIKSALNFYKKGKEGEPVNKTD
ncbi:phosphoribosylanthranilate isomerase [Persephonella sp.]